MKATINFGKINYAGTGKRYPAYVEIELRNCGGEETFTVQNGKRVYTGKTTPEYVELSICGYVYNPSETRCVCGGQCLDTMYQFLKHDTLFKEIYELWKKYHLNGMRAGTPEQENAIAEFEKTIGRKSTYRERIDVLKTANLYEIPFTGITVGRRYENELYKYGYGWIVNRIPGNVLNRIEYIIDTCSSHN